MFVQCKFHAMEKKEAQNCWEYWNCPKDVRDKCPAYTTNSGRSCWMVAGSFTVGETKCARVVHKFEYCWDCPWFKIANPDFDRGNS